MKDLLYYIQNGSRFIVSLNLGKTFDKYMEENAEEYYVLMRISNVVDKWSINRLFKKYYIHEMFDLSNCYMGTNNESFMIWHIAKSKPIYIKTAVCYICAHPYRDDDILENKLIIPDQYREGYIQYLSKLKSWYDTNVQPNSTQDYEFNQIPYDEFDSKTPFPFFYRKKNTEIRELLRTAQMVPLHELASIAYASIPDNTKPQFARVLDTDRANYPFLPEIQTIDSVQSSERLHKGDIVCSNTFFFLLDKEPEFCLYAPLGTQVIRTRSICPEYLYLYLSSNTAKRIRRAYQIQLEHSSFDLTAFLEEMPVIKPIESESYYKEEFERISLPDIRVYSKQREMVKSDTLEQALTQELAQKIKLNNQELIKKQIDEDINELNVCYANQAYKSTLIMAGSIMEAILIDWLSEIRGINYFEETLYKRKWNYDRKCYEKDKYGNYIYMPDKRADLADYIDEIRDIKKPHWMEEAKEAHLIRDKRNLVHAKLCLKKNVQINDRTCREIIDYLKNIIESRWKS